MTRIKMKFTLLALFIVFFGLKISSVWGQELASSVVPPSMVSSETQPSPTKHSLPAPAVTEPSLKKASPPLLKKAEPPKPIKVENLPKPAVREGNDATDSETQRDIMEEALALLNESHTYWVNGNLEDALEMLDQAYALLLDANGNPEMARQKDDLRLMISKRILTIYNSIQTNAKGKRGEIPLITNGDVEKEIRLFQTVERDFFISSYQRSAMYRPIMVKELQKAGLPEELSWLPLVESGFKISALSSARALGLWQFIPSTGYKYGLNRDDWVDERMDIEKSTRAAIDYLKELHTMFGDWLTVLAAYNCGEGRVMRTIAAQHINYLDRFWDLYHQLPYETARYVPRFVATLLIIRDPQKYGMELGTGNEKGNGLSYEIAEVNKSMRLQEIAQKLDASEEILNILNAELRHKITPDKPYKLKVPLEMAEKLQKVIDDIPQCDKPYIASRTGRSVVIKHKVRQGETLAFIANKYKTSAGAIRKANHLSKNEKVVAGQRLTITVASVSTLKGSSEKGQKKVEKTEKSVRYTVQKGDTLASIARKYGTTISEIKKTNRLDADTLKSGQALRILKEDEEPQQDQKKEAVEGGVRKTKKGQKSSASKDTELPAVKKYTVKKGDNLNKIARENNIPLDKLRQMNSLAHKDSIHPGQVILIR